MEGKKGISEDWLSLWMGLFVFVLGLGLFVGLDILGWGIKTNVWIDLTKSINPFSGGLKVMPGITSLFLTYIFMLVITQVGAIAMGANVGRFMLGSGSAMPAGWRATSPTSPPPRTRCINSASAGL